MAEPPRPDEAEALRVRVEELERERHTQTARANAALAAAQDRNYWLDRWNVDLNALMRRRGASQVRAVLGGTRQFVKMARASRARTRTIPMLGAETAPVAPAPAARAAELARTISPDPLFAAPVTELLHGRLEPAHVTAIESRLDVEQAAQLAAADPTERRRLLLAFAAHHDVQAALEATGLSAAMPGPGVHAMAQGPLAAGGSYYYADLVVDALRQSGYEFAPGHSGLDFGCSSGRVVRVLAAAGPEIAWYGCDPIPDAIEWAQAHLPGISFSLSPERPPLSYPDHRFEFVFAISIWSHFAEDAALAWLAEMKRIIRPGGRLLITTHGEQTITHTRREGVRSGAQLAEVRDSLFQHGYWYAAEFGEAGDHGVANPGWGTSFLTAEWMLAKATPEWRVAFFRPGRVEGNQDLYVLEPR
jgi:SAM-dependent methyltransferase